MKKITVEEITHDFKARLDQFATIDANLVDQLKLLLQALYREGVGLEPEKFSQLKDLPPAFDYEQIWALLERRRLKADDWILDSLQDLETATEAAPALSQDDESEQLESDDSLQDDDGLGEVGSDVSDELGEASEEVEEVSEEASEGVEDANGLEDGFFDLNELNKVADIPDEELDKRFTKNRNVDGDGDDDDDDDEEDIDFFNDPDGMELEESDEEAANDIYYQDFFKPPTKIKKRRFEDAIGLEEGRKRVQFSPSDQEDDQQQHIKRQQQKEAPLAKKNLLEEEDDDEGIEVKGELSKFEKNQQEIKALIQKLEEEATEDKPWTLTGETTSRRRPINSLLEEDLEFEHAAKVVPVVTVETTLSLEDMIKQRILNNQFNDVERKVINKFNSEAAARAQVELADERSKLSLAEIYEKSYLEKTGQTYQPTHSNADKEHADIEQLYQSLCRKLDSLANFYFVPEYQDMEVREIKNTPALELEEVGPQAVASEFERLAPNEIYEAKQGRRVEATELTKQEKHSNRLKKKRVARHKTHKKMGQKSKSDKIKK